jgi:formylglycine-generating enzyme required for sulfatase activity
MAAHEVTQAEYQELMNENPSQFVGDPRRPVEKVSWRDAVDYCDRLTRHEAAANRLPIGWVYRLPTEAEWEYACRAGSTSRFTHGPDPDERELPGHAWFSDNSESSTHPVETRRANPWGIHDLSGNVLEWCLDSASSSLPGNTVTNLVNREKSQLRVARGGSWLYPGKACRSANRDTYAASTRCSDVGFRVVLAPAD